MAATRMPERFAPARTSCLIWLNRENVGLVILGHDPEQWEGLKKLPEYYE